MHQEKFVARRRSWPELMFFTRGLLCAMLALSMPAQAELEEVVVTATRTGETSLNDTALTVTALDAQSLIERGISNLDDLSAVVPGFTWTQNQVYQILTVRGIGTNSVFIGGDPSTIVNLDGVYIARPAAQYGLLMEDVERVEILRGPQTTLYGRNAAAGAINIITFQPDAAPALKGTLKYGSYNDVEAGAYASARLSPAVYVGVAAQTVSRDGYVDVVNENRVQDHVGNEDSHSFRGKLLLEPGKDWRVDLSADYFKADFAPNLWWDAVGIPADGVVLGDIHEVRLNDRCRSVIDRWGTALTIRRSGQSTEVTSITAYRESDLETEADLDMSSADILHTRWFPEYQHQFSQEFNVTGHADRLTWIGGVYYMREAGDSPFNFEIVPAGLLQTGGIVDVDVESYAAYGQASYELTDRVALTVGARYTRDRKEAVNQTGFGPLNQDEPPATQVPENLIFRDPASGTFDAVTPKFGLELRPRLGLLLYASISRGFKSGGFNLNDPLLVPSTYDEETVWAYEVGAKQSLLDNRLQVNVAGFVYDYHGYQVLILQSLGGMSGATVASVANADKVDVRGVEMEVMASPLEDFQFGLSLAYLDAKFASDELFPNNETGGVEVADGNTLPGAAPWTASLYVAKEWRITAGALQFRVDASYQDDTPYAAANTAAETAPDYSLLNARLAFTTSDGRWTFALTGRNITDEQYFTGAATLLGPQRMPGAPRTLIGSVTYQVQ